MKNKETKPPASSTILDEDDEELLEDTSNQIVADSGAAHSTQHVTIHSVSDDEDATAATNLQQAEALLANGNLDSTTQDFRVGTAH